MNVSRRLRFARFGMSGFLFLAVATASSVVSAADSVTLQAAFLRGDYDAVVREARRVDQKSEMDDTTLYLWGVSALQRDHLEEGQRLLNRLLSEHAGTRWRGQARLAVGQSLEDAGRDADAAETYETLLKEEGSRGYSAQALLHLAKVQMRLGQWNESRVSLRTLLQRAPDSQEAATARDLLQQGSLDRKSTRLNSSH